MGNLFFKARNPPLGHFHVHAIVGGSLPSWVSFLNPVLDAKKPMHFYMGFSKEQKDRI
jgi:hypothetical protein